MKRLILITIVSLSLLLSSCTSCNPFGKGGDESSDSTIIEESSNTQNAENSSHQQDDSEHHSSRTTEQLGDKKNENSGTLTGKEESSSKPEESSSKPESSKPEESSSKPEESSSESSSESSEESSAGESGPTDGQKKALAKAKEYLNDGTGWSFVEIVNNLDSDGFDHSDVLWAMDNLDADWKEQAATRAKNIIGMGPASRSMMIDELKNHAEFTQEEAEYGADNCGADWKEQALLYAQYCLNKGAYSETILRMKMENEVGFEDTEINYAMSEITENDWNQEAVETAEEIAPEKFYVGMPESDFIDLIKDRGFTDSQATYGAENCTINWKVNTANGYILDNTPTSPSDLTTFLSGEGYSKSDIIEILDYYNEDGGGVWYYQAGEYADYMQGSVLTFKEMVDMLKSAGFTEDQAWQGVYNKGGFSEDELAYYRIYQIINNLDGSNLADEDKIKSKIVAMLVDEGFSETAADSAATSFGLTESVPKG